MAHAGQKCAMAQSSNTVIKGISSMATRQLLAELCEQYTAATGQGVAIEAVGGVDAAKRVAAGEAFDLVLLASDAIDRLTAAGHLAPRSRVDIVRSPVAVAVQAGVAQPDISTADALKKALLAAKTIGYSTGPSGTHLVQLFERWGLAAELGAKTVQAPPGVPVGALVARGEVEIGFQQLSELISLEGITVLGLLPGDCAFITTFSAGVPANTAQAAAVKALLDFFNSPNTVAVKRRHGMEPA
jgi:molybdate transport system substrate-binding protein